MSTYASFISVIQYLYITFQKVTVLRCARARPHTHTHTHTHIYSLSLSLSLSGFLNLLAILVGVIWSKTYCVQHVLIHNLCVVTRPVTVAEFIPI